MEKGLQIREWDFDKDALCFNCRAEAVQRIEVTPEELVVTCVNCGAERHYELECSHEARQKPRFDVDTSRLRYDAWKFEHEARCTHCHNRTKNEVTIDERKAAIVCPACLFSRIYGFHAFSKSKRWSQ